MKKYNVWFEEPVNLDEELLEVCKLVVEGDESYFIVLDGKKWEIPMADEISELMQTEDVKKVKMQDLVVDVVDSVRNGKRIDECMTTYYDSKCLVVCNMEEIIGKNVTISAFTEILCRRITNGKKNILIGTKSRCEELKELFPLLRGFKIVHVEYVGLNT